MLLSEAQLSTRQGSTQFGGYGRRGSTLNTGSKTSSPVSYDEAKRIFDKLVREKTAKGYTPGAGGTPYVGSSSDKQPSGYLPPLLNPIEEADVKRPLRDNEHCAQLCDAQHYCAYVE